MNYLEQLVSEYYEYQGFFVQKNIKVGLRKGKGGYDGELDIVAFHLNKNKLVHVECSSDTNSWEKRDETFKRKFETGKKHIHKLFEGLVLPEEIEQYALLLFGSKQNKKEVGGYEFKTMQEFFGEIVEELKDRKFENEAVPENLPLLRTLQLFLNYQPNKIK